MNFEQRLAAFHRAYFDVESAADIMHFLVKSMADEGDGLFRLRE